jgi:hypothetical protein
MKMTKALAVGVGMAMLLPALASAVVLEGHFSGHATHAGPAPGVYANNLAYDAYAILDDVQVNPWYPWDQVNYEYTVWIDAVILNYTGLPYPWVPGVNGTETADFNVAAVHIYEDAGTPADYANPATFKDGTEILTGVVQNMIGEHVVFWVGGSLIDLPWTITGVVVMTGGTGIANLDSQCAGGLVMNDFVNFAIGTQPPGYQESYDIEWKCPEVSTGVEETTWGRMKGLYR